MAATAVPATAPQTQISETMRGRNCRALKPRMAAMATPQRMKMRGRMTLMMWMPKWPNWSKAGLPARYVLWFLRGGSETIKGSVAWGLCQIDQGKAFRCSVGVKMCVNVNGVTTPFLYPLLITAMVQ